MRRAIFVGLLCVLLGACASARANTMQRFAGAWDWHFETSAFTTDDGEGPYWLSADAEAWERLEASFGENGPWGRARLVVEGRLSPPGRYGHLGAYSRELHVTRVIEAEVLAARGSSVP